MFFGCVIGPNPRRKLVARLDVAQISLADPADLVSAKAPQEPVGPGEHHAPAPAVHQVESFLLRTQDAVSLQPAAVRRLRPPHAHPEFTRQRAH